MFYQPRLIKRITLPLLRCQGAYSILVSPFPLQHGPAQHLMEKTFLNQRKSLVGFQKILAR